MFGFDPKKYHKVGSDSLGGGALMVKKILYLEQI